MGMTGRDGDGADGLPPMGGAPLAALRRLRFAYAMMETGGPAVDPLTPFGSSDPLADLSAVAPGADEAALRRLYVEAMDLLPRFVRAAAPRLAPGRYALPAEDAARLRDGPFASEHTGLGPDGGFDYTAEHAVILPLLCWGMEGTPDSGPLTPDAILPTDIGDPDGPAWPGPIVDGKRPYGTSSYPEVEMAEALGLPVAAGDSPLTEEVAARLLALHHTTPAALRVLVLHGAA